MLLIGLNSKFYEIFAKQQIYINPQYCNKISSESKQNQKSHMKNTENCKLFLAIVCNSYDCSNSLITISPFRNGV